MGELSDVKFRKADLLKLMAEREGPDMHKDKPGKQSDLKFVSGVDYRNVITVGEPLTGLKASRSSSSLRGAVVHMANQ